MSDSVTPRTVARQAPLSVGFFRQEYWSGLPFPSPGDLPNPGMETASLISPAFAGGFFTTNNTWETPCVCVCMYIYRRCAKSLQTCLTLCGLMDCSPPGSSVPGILQARILEQLAIPFSRGSSRPRETWVFLIAGRFFTI